MFATDSLAALQQKRLERLAREAEELAMQQRTGGTPSPHKAGEPSLTKKMDKLAADLMELSQKSAGPEANAMAKEAVRIAEVDIGHSGFLMWDSWRACCFTRGRGGAAPSPWGRVEKCEAFFGEGKTGGRANAALSGRLSCANQSLPE